MTWPARLLDITRLIRRAGRIPTGIDRVERAYLNAVVAADVPAFGLARTRLGYLLLDQSGMVALQQFCDAPDALQQARRMAIARTVPIGLSRAMQRHIPAGVSYLNIGHSNLTDRVLGGIKQALNGHISVFVHDVIPLTHSAVQRPGTAESFAKKMRATARFADQIIVNSADTLQHASAQFEHWNGTPKGLIAHLGCDLAVPNAAELPAHLPPQVPYFVAIGTIEPRKNTSFLLDLWQTMGPEAPTLVICGARGWDTEEVFQRLDTAKAGHGVVEANSLSDGAVAALLQGASGLLFPSIAEGFGLPVIEAAAAGTPILANDLPVLREVAGNIPIYASVNDQYLWIRTIKQLAQSPRDMTKTPVFSPPTWGAHFNKVLSVA